jgi:hypothetical protein
MILLSFRVGCRTYPNRQRLGALIASDVACGGWARRVLVTMTARITIGKPERSLWAWADGRPRTSCGIAGNIAPANVWVCHDGGLSMVTYSTGVALLWALAMEIDECGETSTGECPPMEMWSDGPATVIGRGGEVIGTTKGPIHVRIGHPSSGPRIVHTTTLASIVAHLASQRSPIVTDWPEQWAVDVDAMEANGWGDTWLPSQGEPPKPWLAGKWEPLARPTWSRKHDSTPAWMCVWWREFREWVTAGREPDAGELARLLDERTAARRASPVQRFVDDVWISVAGRRIRDLVDSDRVRIERDNSYGTTVTLPVWAGGQDDEFLRAAQRAAVMTGHVVDVRVVLERFVHQGPHVFEGRGHWSNGSGHVATYRLLGGRDARVADPDPRA